MAKKLHIDCSHGATGFVYKGKIPFKTTKTVLEKVPKLPVDVMVNIAEPGSAFFVS